MIPGFNLTQLAAKGSTEHQLENANHAQDAYLVSACTCSFYRLAGLCAKAGSKSMHDFEIPTIGFVVWKSKRDQRKDILDLDVQTHHEWF